MALPLDDPSWSDLGNIAQQAFKSSGRAYEGYIRSKYPNLQLESSPVAEMASSSPITSYFKQVLPNKVSDTEIGRLIAGVLPEELKRKVENIELGGMSAKELQEFRDARAKDVDLRRSTIEVLSLIHI